MINKRKHNMASPNPQAHSTVGK
uniref:Uncharacterized protein n=1 Tax=Arundo donax TaxID=35708 RepID=A0A0A8YS97_ARUDO